VERSVWPVFVVVTAVDAEDVFEVASAENQDAVESVSADRAHPALGVGVRVRVWVPKTRFHALASWEADLVG
jgi:hypothetical protein